MQQFRQEPSRPLIASRRQRRQFFLSAVSLELHERKPGFDAGAVLREVQERFLPFRREWVEGALEKLPAHQRVPLVLFHFEDMPYEDIARKTGVSLSKVKTDILRGREALAKILMRSGASHEKFTT